LITHGFDVRGALKDKQTRCEHYHLDVDIVAIKFKCCNTYYSCCKCHEEGADHPTEVWKKQEFENKAILCGACGTELTINEYLDSMSSCHYCNASFNSRCKYHSHLYFDLKQIPLNT
jgi:uncharacterized CHY-type Zn-finger protein